MGHRANFVLVEQGKATIYYSHWGAKTIPDMLVAGPDRCWNSIQRLTPGSELLDNVWAEGGLLLDRDQRRLLFWGGEEIKYTPYLRRVFLPALRLLWPEWTVEWALYGVADLADALHIDRSAVLIGEFAEGFHPENPLSDEVLLENEFETTLITIKEKDGMVLNYRMCGLPGSILSVGPHLLDVLARKKPDTLPHERDEEFEEGAFLDLANRQIWVWEKSTLDPRYLAALRTLWPGWYVAGHGEGIVRQVILSGHDPFPIMVPQDEARAALLKVLAAEDLPMPTLSNLVNAITTAVPEEASQVKIASGFFSVPDQILSGQERRQILQQVFSQLPD
jgi:hypothetical protein